LEHYSDSITGKEYSLHECARCDFTFSSPRESPSVDYYAKIRQCGHMDSDYNVPEWRLRFLKKLNVKSKKLLDIGCGYGHFLRGAKSLGFEVSGLDFDKEKISCCRKKGITNAYCSEFDQFYCSIIDSRIRYNVISCFHILEHVPEPKEFIEKIRDILLPEGYLLLEVPNKNRILSGSSGFFDYPPHHFTRWSTNSLRLLLSKKGFKVLNVHIPLEMKSFYENLFSSFTLCLSFLYKRIKKQNKFQVNPINFEKTDSNKRNLNFRQGALFLLRFFYKFIFIPLSFPVMVPVAVYLKAKGKGFVIFVTAQK